eukprot:GHVS01014406.1.p1 GENE.GHVS01014406.1~~GHVS01014406.1.p1  ORF type:complete len:517 (-),score=117.17 GHVS01014406.1:310-1860(-)
MEVTNFATKSQGVTPSSVVRRSVSFSEAKPVTHRYCARSRHQSFSPGSLASFVVTSLCALSCMVLLYAFFAVGAVAGRSTSGSSVEPQLLVLPSTDALRSRTGLIAQTLRGGVGAVNLDKVVDMLDLETIEGLAEEEPSKKEKTGASRSAETESTAAPLLLEATNSLRGVTETVQSVFDGGALLSTAEDASLGLGLKGHDGVMLPAALMSDAVEVIEEMAEEIEMEAREMRRSIQMLLRRAGKRASVEGVTLEGGESGGQPITPSISLTGLRKHLRAGRGGAEAAGVVDLEAADRRVRGGLGGGGGLAAGEAVDLILGENGVDTVGDAVEQKLADATEFIQRGAKHSLLGGSGVRGGGETGEAVFEAVVGVVEELKEQGDDILTANVMAGVGGIVAASADKLRGSTGQTEDVAIMDGVVDVITQEVRKIGGGGRLRGAAGGNNASVEAVTSTSRTGGLKGLRGGRGGGETAEVEEEQAASVGRVRRSRGEEVQSERAEAREIARESRLRTASSNGV